MRASAAIAAAAVLLLAGCAGCGGGGSAGSPGGGADRSGTAGTATGGRPRGPVSVAAENRRPGTRAWRLSARPGAGIVEGYVSAQETAAGSVERFYVRAPAARWVRVELFRLGWYGGRGGRLVLRSPTLPARDQPPCAHSAQTGLTECRWRATWSPTLPADLVSGVYVGKLVTDRGAQKDTLLVVRAARPGRVLAELSTATYEAYNDYGGTDLYPAALPVGVTGTTQGVEVSYDRPYDTTTGAGQLFARDIAMVRWLERSGLPVTYTTDTGVDGDPAMLRSARVVLDIGHSEYWSQAAHDAFAAARDAGVSLAFFTSDTMGWRVRYAPAGAGSSEAGTADHAIIAYKEHASLDPDRGQPSGRFPDGGASITGTVYDNCITPKLSAGPPPVYRYYPWRVSARAPAWLLRGTGLSAGSAVAGITGYELDRLAPAPPAGTIVVGRGEASCQSAAAGSTSAASVLYRAPSGAYVFAAGTMGWQLGLSPVPDTSPDAPRHASRPLVRLTRNLLRRMLAR